jgi:hypothetical protein
MTEDMVDGYRFFSFATAELANAKDFGYYCDAYVVLLWALSARPSALN